MLRSAPLRSTVLLLVGALATVAAFVAIFTARYLVDADGFGDRAAEVIRQPAVSHEVAVELTAALERAVPDAVVAQRPIEDAVSSLVAKGAFDPIVRRAAATLHRGLFSADASQVSLDLSDGLRLVNSLVVAQGGTPKGLLANAGSAPLVELDHRGPLAVITSSGRAILVLAWVLPLLALVCFAGAIATARDRPRAVGHVGVALAASGVSLLTIESLLVTTLAGQGRHAAAIREALEVFLAGVGSLAAGLLGAGALLAVVGYRKLSSGTADRVIARAWRYVRTTPSERRPAAARAAILFALGAALLLAPLTTIEAVALILGFLVTVEALSAAVDLFDPPVVLEQPGAARRSSGLLVFGGVAAALLIVTAIINVDTAREPAVAQTLDHRCNGSARLCDRPLDAVAFATAHNAMSSAEAGFIDPNQRRTMIAQLDAGVRGLLVDSLMARPTARRATALTVLDGEVRRQAEEEVGPGGITALQDFLGRRVAKPTGPPAPFLCHMACELGATPMVEAMIDLRRWLEAHPREVVVLVVQDLVTPKATEQVFRDAGLLSRTYTWRPGTPAPTLRNMLDQRRQLLVMAEADGIAGSWYPAGYDRLLKETPYDSPSLAALRRDASCAPNRGRERNPLFLINHWAAVYPPLPSKAKAVNTRQALLERVRRCSRIRNAFPNLIAVDFADIGDVVEVAAVVNGLQR